MSMLAASLCLLAACAGSVPADPIELPPSLAAPCERPVDLTARDMTQVEVERSWGTDRTNLNSCADRYEAVTALFRLPSDEE